LANIATDYQTLKLTPKETKMDLVLYYSPIACSLVPYVTLTEAGADFEVRNINLRKGQQSSPDYLKLNPKHKVPVLMVDGQVLTENVAIQLWIARNFPEAKLLPTDPWQELKAKISSRIGGVMSAPVWLCDIISASFRAAARF
jgi:glutathione S-transferase